MKAARYIGVGWFLLDAGCSDASFSSSPELVTEPRIIAVIAEPPEARPGQTVAYRAVYAAPRSAETRDTTWTYCTTPRAPGKRGIVAEACRSEEGIPLGRGRRVEARLPLETCQRFGPDPAPTTAGVPTRPQDPDASGGYYAPVRVEAWAQLWFHFQRTWCALPDAPSALWNEFVAQYPSNQNPRATGVGAAGMVLPVEGAADALPTVEPISGSDLELALLFPLEAQEKYVVLNIDAARIVERTERVLVDAYVSAGKLDPTTTGLTATDTGWTASFTLTDLPPGTTRFWLVARDERGGSSAYWGELGVE